MDLKPITNDEELAMALAELEQLWPPTGAPEPGTREADHLGVLGILIDAYERQKVPDLPPDPVAAIELRMEQLGLGRKDLEAAIGTRSRVHEVLARKRRLTLPMIRRLRRMLGIPADALVGGDDDAEERPSV